MTNLQLFLEEEQKEFEKEYKDVFAYISQNESATTISSVPFWLMDKHMSNWIHQSHARLLGRVISMLEEKVQHMVYNKPIEELIDEIKSSVDKPGI